MSLGVFLECDGCSDNITAGPIGTGSVIRAEAKTRNGWHVGLPGGRDLCPECWQREQGTPLDLPKRGKDGYLALPCGSLFVNFAEWNDDHRPACATCLGNFGPTPDPDHDQLGCLEWCNHCSVCGTGILYGSLCRAHYNVPLER